MIPTVNRNAMQRTDDVVRSRQRLASLLGHPQKLDAAEVARRRAMLAGLPIHRDDLGRVDAGAVAAIVGEHFTVNTSDLIISDLVADLNVTGLTAPNAASSEAAREYLWSCWEASDLLAGTEGLFTAAAGDGQSFLVVDMAEGEATPTAYVNAAYDGTEGIEVLAVSGKGHLLACLKHEQEVAVRDRMTGAVQQVSDWLRNLVGIPLPQQVEYLQRHIRTEYVYDEDSDRTRIRHFVTDPNVAERQMVSVNGRWEPAEGYEGDWWPYGFPIVPFVSPGGGELAELETPQRLVNSAALDLASAARVDGQRVGWMLNCKPLPKGRPARSAKGSRWDEDDPEAVYFKTGAWLELQARDEDHPAGVGTIPACDLQAQLANFRQAVETHLMLARASVHALAPWQASAAPSGTALWLASKPFRAKVQRYQESWTSAFGQLFTLWQRMGGKTVEPVKPSWRTTVYLPPTELYDMALKAQALGQPTEQIAEMLDLTPDQIQAWEEERDAAQAEQEAMAKALAKAAPAAPPAKTTGQGGPTQIARPGQV